MCDFDSDHTTQDWLELVRDPVTRAVMNADGVTEAALLDLLRDVCQQRGCLPAAASVHSGGSR